MTSVNFYDVMPKTYLDDQHYNPNKHKGCPIHPFRMLIVGGSGSMKSNTCLNIIKDCNCWERIYLFAKNLDEPLYRFLIDTFSKIGNGSVLVASDDVSTIPSPDEFDKSKQNLVIIDDMITADKKQFKPIQELFIRGRKQNISTIFISQSFHAIPKLIRLNTNVLILKQISSNKDFSALISNYNLNSTPKELKQLYEQVTRDKKDSLYIDLDAMTEKMKFRKNYLLK